MGEFRCATRPVFDAMTVRLPLLLARAMCAACARYISAFTLIAKSRSNSSGVVSSMNLGSVTPALPTAASSPPKRSTAIFTAASFVARWATSPARVAIVPLAVRRVVVRAREVLRRVEAVLCLAVHEHAPAEEVNLHLGDAHLAQARKHRGPHLGVLLFVPRDDLWIVAQVERHSVGLHLRIPARPRPARASRARTAPRHFRRRSARGRRSGDLR